MGLWNNVRSTQVACTSYMLGPALESKGSDCTHAMHHMMLKQVASSLSVDSVDWLLRYRACKVSSAAIICPWIGGLVHKSR